MEDDAARRQEGVRFLILVGLSLALVIGVFAHQVGGYGVLAGAGSLRHELHGVDSDPFDRPWELGEEPPYCYRPLFRWLVLTAYGLLPAQTPTTFYAVFLILSAMSLWLAALSTDWLLRELGFSSREALAGMALFLLGFPVLFAYDQPIHTREDLLGYAFIALTLVAVVRDKPYLVALLAAVGVGIRETCLLGVLPLWFVSSRSRQERAMAYLVPGIVLLLIRALRDPGRRYDFLGISTAPTLEHPTEALLYLFACFGLLWVAAGLQLSSSATPRHPLLSRRVVLLALGATAATGWTMGMIREARITYILFPFVIPLALDFFTSPRGRRIVRAEVAWGAAVAILLAGMIGTAILRDDPGRVDLLRPWIGESFNPGVVPLESAIHEGEEVLVIMTQASPYNGPVVLVHLAGAVLLLLGALVIRKRSAPESGSESGSGSDSQTEP